MELRLGRSNSGLARKDKEFAQCLVMLGVCLERGVGQVGGHLWESDIVQERKG